MSLYQCIPTEAARAAFPFLQRVQYLCVQTMGQLPVFGTFNMHANVEACNCTQGLDEHLKRVCSESWHWEKNPLPHCGIKPVSVALLSGLALSQLGYTGKSFFINIFGWVAGDLIVSLPASWHPTLFMSFSSINSEAENITLLGYLVLVYLARVCAVGALFRYSQLFFIC